MSYNENPPNMPNSVYNGSKKKTTKKAVSTQKKIFFLFAVIAGMLSVLLMLSGKTSVYVARSTVDIQPQTLVSADQVEIVSVSPNAVEPGAYTSKNSTALKNKILNDVLKNKAGFQILKGQQIRENYFPVSSLASDEQLIQISADPSDAVEGTIHTGDFVNIWAGLPNGGAVSLISSNIQIYAIGLHPTLLNSVANSQMSTPSKNVSSYLPSQPLPGSYIIKVKSNEVSKYVALVNGVAAGTKIYLTKVSGSDAIATTQTPPLESKDVICGNINTGSCARK